MREEPAHSEMAGRLMVALAVNGVAVLAAYALRTVNRGGAAMGFILGTVVYTAAGPRAFTLLMIFFALGSGATRIGYRKKLAAGIAQEEGGARGWPHAVAKTGAAVLLALASALTPYRDLFLVGFAGALAAATGDTTSSEVGKALGRPAVLITTLRKVSPGTTGAISLEGTLSGLGGSFLVAGAGAWLGLVSMAQIPWITLAGFIGFMLESYLGALLETRGLLNNEQVNFANTVMGAGAAMILVKAAGA